MAPKKTKAMEAPPAVCGVTGGTGLVGRRLVEMLAERGAKTVVSFDVAPKPADASERINGCQIIYVKGDITKYEQVLEAFKDCGCIWHIAALVGPYHDFKKYYEVNYKGTLNIINACKELGIQKVVMSSSPSTRFDGNDIAGKGVEDLTFPKTYTHVSSATHTRQHTRTRTTPTDPSVTIAAVAREDFLTDDMLSAAVVYSFPFLALLACARCGQAYAETKAMGERAMSEACDGSTLLTVAIAPHQVYGPRDMLFLHNFLVARKKLRIIGDGKNKISMTHVDNYCHGLILGEKALYPGSPALGNFYIVTDKEPQYLWQALDQAFVYLGYKVRTHTHSHALF